MIEFANEVWFDGVQYGYLTDKCRRQYAIQSEQACVAIQSEERMFCVHAQAYTFKKRTTADAVGIYASPLDTTAVIGQFTRALLVCDTLLTIEDRQWAVLHHMMYTPLKLTGIPQAWVVLNDKEEQYFEKVETSAAFKAELEAYVSSDACWCVVCNKQFTCPRRGGTSHSTADAVAGTDIKATLITTTRALHPPPSKPPCTPTRHATTSARGSCPCTAPRHTSSPRSLH